MISTHFTYHKPKVIQALRYHFINRKEIKVMMIMVNVFALLSAVLYYMKKISPAAFMLGSLLWFLMMLTFWFFLPRLVYKKSATFKDHFDLEIDHSGLNLSNERGAKHFQWPSFVSWLESPHFFHLYLSPTSFFLIPKDSFNENNLSIARDYLSKGIKNRL